MFERFTEKAIKVIMLSQEESRRLGHNFVGTEQILLGLIGEGTGIAARVLKSTGISLKDARIEVEKIIGRGSGFVVVEIPFTPRAKRALELSWESARQIRHDYIGTEHLLLGLLDEGGGVANQVLENLGVQKSSLRVLILSELGKSGSDYKVPGAELDMFTGILINAHRVARDRNKSEVDMEDVLIGIVMSDDTAASKALNAFGVDVSNLSTRIDIAQAQSEATPSTEGEMPLSDSVQQWLARAVLLSQNYNHPPASLLLLDLLEPGKLRVLKILEGFGVDMDLLRDEIMSGSD